MLAVRCIVMQHYVRRSQLKQLYVEGRDGIPAITTWKRPSSVRCHNLKTLIYPQQQLQVTDGEELLGNHVSERLYPFRCDGKLHQLH